jgi:hypothetical protein
MSQIVFFDNPASIVQLQQQTASLTGAVSTLQQQTASLTGAVSTLQRFVSPSGMNAPILSSNGISIGGGNTGVLLHPIVQSDNNDSMTIPCMSSDYIEFGSGLSTIFMGASSEYIENFTNGKHNMIMKPKWLIDDTEKLILVLGMLKDVTCNDATLGKYSYYAGDPRANGSFKYFDKKYIAIEHIEKLYKEIDVNKITDNVFKTEYDIANTVIKMIKQFKKTTLANSGLELLGRTYEVVNELRQGYYSIQDFTVITKPSSKNGVEAYKNFLLSIQSIVTTLKQDTINAIMTGGYRPHLLKNNPNSVKTNPLYQAYDGIVKGRWNALKNTYPTSTFNATSNITSLVSSGRITAAEATGAVNSYTNIVNDISVKYNDYFNYIQNPTGVYQTSMIRNDYPGMYAINANTGIGDNIYKYQLCFYAGYAENDSVLSMAKINNALTGSNYTNVQGIFNNFSYFLDTNPNTDSVEKLHDVGFAFNTLFNDIKDFAAKQLRSLTGAFDGMTTNQIAEAIFRKAEMKSDRDVLGVDYNVKNPDGTYVFNANLGFQYVWLEHYTGPAGSLTGTLLNRFATASIANYNNNTADKVTFYRNYLQDYTRKFLNTNIKPILNQFLGPRSLAEYNALLTKDPILIGGSFPGFASATLDAPNQQVFWIAETNNPKFFNLGWFRSTIVLHEWLLGHGLEIPVAYNSLAANSSKFSYARRHIRSSYQGEGWATYMELFGHEIGLFNKVNSSGALINTGNYLNDVDWESVLCGAVDTSRSAARLVCDTELNYSKYAKSFTEVEAKFKELTGYFFEEDYIGLSVRFTGQPGQSLGYAPGCISILAAKNVAKAALGANFNVGDFHDFILIDNPSYSIDSLREATLRYIASKQ